MAVDMAYTHFGIQHPDSYSLFLDNIFTQAHPLCHGAASDQWTVPPFYDSHVCFLNVPKYNNCNQRIFFLGAESPILQSPPILRRHPTVQSWQEPYQKPATGEVARRVWDHREPNLN